MKQMKIKWISGPSNVKQIYDACIRSIQSHASTGSIPLVLAGMKPASQHSRHLVGRNSPKGEIVADGDSNSQIVSFKVIDLLAWLVANKFCEYEVLG
jgi:hypothetical protein